MRLGFVGAGRIGRRMVRRLVAAGHETRVLARSEEARSALAGAGAVPVSSLAEVVAEAEIVFVCLFSDDQVRQVCLGDGPDDRLIALMGEGSVLVVHTTASPRTTQALVDRAAARSIQVVDSPISGGPPDIDAGAVTLLVGGADSALAVVAPVLKAYGDPVLHLGPPGSGQKAKLINNAIFVANIGVLAHALDLGTTFGLEQGPLLAALQHGSSSSRVLEMIARAGSATVFASSAGEFITKDMAVVGTVVADLGGSLGPLEAAYDAVSTLLTTAAITPEPAALSS